MAINFIFFFLKKKIDNEINNKIIEFKIGLNEEDDCKFFLKNRKNKNLAKCAARLIRNSKEEKEKIAVKQIFDSKNEVDKIEKEIELEIKDMNKEFHKLKELSISDDTTVQSIKEKIDNINKKINKLENKEEKVEKEEKEELSVKSENLENNIYIIKKRSVSSDKRNELKRRKDRRSFSNGKEVIVRDHVVAAYQPCNDRTNRKFPTKYEEFLELYSIRERDYAFNKINNKMKDINELNEIASYNNDNISKIKQSIQITTEMVNESKIIRRRRPIPLEIFVLIVERYLNILDEINRIPKLDVLIDNKNRVLFLLNRLRLQIFEELHLIV